MASSSSSASEKKMIVLISKEGEKFEVNEVTALLSQTVKNMIEDDCTAGGIPLPNVDSTTLVKVIEYCKHHLARYAADLSGDDEARKKSDTDIKDFVKAVKEDQTVLFDLILAANYLDIKVLLDLMCQTVADMMKGKSIEEIRKLFHIKNDYSQEEEEEVRKEVAWAFE